MKKHFLLILLVLINLIVGLFSLPGYGESTDELSQHLYAQRTIQGVKALVATGPWPAYFMEEEPKQGSHGPAFIVAINLLRDVFVPRGTSIERLHFSHLLYFLIFLMGAASLFLLARRWLSETAAFGTALLFSTQPVLLGHALMNPKDIVFMSLLIASTTAGLWMVDRQQNGPRQTERAPLDGVRSFFRQFLCGDIWLAGLVLGFSAATRICAPLVGVMVLAYVLLSRKWSALPRVMAYGLIAFGSMILFWPYLWPDPLGRLLESFANCAHYPDVHSTLFNGRPVGSDQLPLSYFPVLLVIQLTETTLLLILLGLVSLRKNLRWDLMLLVLIWFALPTAAIVGMRMSLYNNLRQVFFILPPLFLLAGLGLDWLLTFIRRPIVRVLILFLALLPGLYANGTLYPYQYVYYNQIVGGVDGAFRRFELDYWHLAFREAQEYINQNADANANIFVGNSKTNVQTFARPDLVFNAFGSKNKRCESYDYLIVSTAQNADAKYAALSTVFVVERDGIPLVYVKIPIKGIR